MGSYVDGTSFYGRHSDTAVSLPRGYTRCKVGYERGYMECGLCSQFLLSSLFFLPLILDHLIRYSS